MAGRYKHVPQAHYRRYERKLQKWKDCEATLLTSPKSIIQVETEFERVVSLAITCETHTYVFQVPDDLREGKPFDEWGPESLEVVDFIQGLLQDTFLFGWDVIDCLRHLPTRVTDGVIGLAELYNHQVFRYGKTKVMKADFIYGNLPTRGKRSYEFILASGYLYHWGRFSNDNFDTFSYGGEPWTGGAVKTDHHGILFYYTARSDELDCGQMAMKAAIHGGMLNLCGETKSSNVDEAYLARHKRLVNDPLQIQMLDRATGLYQTQGNRVPREKKKRNKHRGEGSSDGKKRSHAQLEIGSLHSDMAAKWARSDQED